MKRLLALGVVWLGLAAATPLPLTPPPPDLAALVPFAVAPLDKPALTVDAKLPPASIELPPLPLAVITVPAGAEAGIADAAAAHAALHRGVDRRGLGIARVRARPLPEGRIRGRRQGAGERRSTGLRARDRHRGALLAGRDLLPARPHRAGRLAVPPGRAGPAPGLGAVGADSAAAGRRCAWGMPRARATPSPPLLSRPVPVPARPLGPLRPRAGELRSRASRGRPERVRHGAPAPAAGGPVARRHLLAGRGARAHRRRRARRDRAQALRRWRAASAADRPRSCGWRGGRWSPGATRTRSRPSVAYLASAPAGAASASGARPD